MEEIKIFENQEFGTIRTIDENGKVLFCGSDVAKMLGYKNPSKALSDHCKGVTKRYIPTNGGKQEMSFISEGDVYRLTAKSELPGADKFESWIFDEVLPSIRQNGGYISGQEEMSAEELMAKALVVAQRTLAAREARISALEAVNQTMKIKSDYFDQLVSRHTLTNFRETAKELKIPPMKFVQFLLDNKFIYRDKRGRLLPYEAKNWDGLFEVKECYSKKNDWSGTQTLVTPKGRETFRLLIRDI